MSKQKWERMHVKTASPAMHAQTAALAAPGTCTNPKTVPGTIRDQGDPLNNLISGTSQLFLFLQICTCRASMDGGEKWEPSMPPHSCMIEHIHREFQAPSNLPHSEGSNSIWKYGGKNWWENNGVPTASRLCKKSLHPFTGGAWVHQGEKTMNTFNAL